MNSAYQFVLIKAGEGREVLLQGDDAHHFIDQLNAYSEQLPDAEQGMLELALAYDYCEILL